MTTGPRILVTGGLGFIGSAFIRNVAATSPVLNIDAFTYAADTNRLRGLPSDRVETIRSDVSDPSIPKLIQELHPAAIVHFAAESHVTRSESAAEAFFRTNVEGTKQVLEGARRAQTPLVLHVSTDEVYGPCLGEPFTEADKQPGEGKATSPYARSKALADDLAKDMSTDVPIIVARMTNCFGPWQHPEKAIGRWITRALSGRSLPVWGDGGQMRDWMHVSDACRGLLLLLDHGRPGEVYNLGPEGEQWSNLQIARLIAREAGRSENDVYLTAYDRPQHDYRYAVDSRRIRDLGWRPQMQLTTGIKETVKWYRENQSWWKVLVKEAESLYQDDKARSEG